MILLLLLSAFTIAALATGCHLFPTFFPFLSPCKGSVARDACFGGEVFFLDSSWHVENISTSTSMNTSIRISCCATTAAAAAAAVDK